MGKKNWPEWSAKFIKSGFPDDSLLAGTEPAVWDALGRLDREDLDDGKQVVVRKALEDIGLGWVATNNTPFRIAIGGLFDAGEKHHRENTQHNQGKKSESGGKPVPSIHVETRTLPETKDAITGPIRKSTATEKNRAAVWHQLDNYGAYVIRKAVPASTLKELPEVGEGKETKLSRTMGNGIAGEPQSVYMDLSYPPEWHDGLEQNIGNLLIGPGAPEQYSDGDTKLKRKSILLLGGENAENWAHQDNNDETPPLQAMLMFNEPQTDFSGGEFYVARQSKSTDKKINIIRYKISFKSPGDLVIFEAGKNSGWWHGMLAVKAGEKQKQGDEHLRQVIGMLQPPD